MNVDGFSRVSANPYFEVFEHAEQRVVLARRTRNVQVGSDQLQIIVWALEAVLDPRTRNWGLVVDTRHAAGNSDPRFEQALIDWTRRATQHFARMAVLVRTPVGAIQAARHNAEATNALVTTQAGQAHAWARGLG